MLAVVDATTFDAQHYASQAARLQVEAADVVLLSKCDLLPHAEDVSAKEAIVRGMLGNVTSPIIATTHGEVPLSLVTGIPPREHAPRGPRAGGDHLVRDDIAVFVYSTPHPLQPAAFEAYMQSGLPPSVFRAKGLIWLQVPIHTLQAP